MSYPEFNKLQNWDRLASVRARPRRMLAESGADKFYFPPDLMPICQHPIIVGLGPDAAKWLLVQRLYQYLDFTMKLEHHAINQTLVQIAHRSLGIDLPRGMVVDAYKIYVDEGYHAFMSLDLIRQVEGSTGISPYGEGNPGLLPCFSSIRSKVPPQLRDLTRLFFAIVSETMISDTLSKIPADQQIVSTVREVVADHAQDEGRHHVYFAEVLNHVWPQLSRQQQLIIGGLLPDFISGFAEPDYEALERLVTACGIDQRDAARVVNESYPQATVVAVAKENSRATLRCLRFCGVLDEPYLAEAFHISGLIS